MTRSLIYFLAFVFIFELSAQAEENIHQVCCGSACYKTYFVQSREEHLKGLSGSQKLAADEAMLFAYAKPGRSGMWMKGMKFSLDMLWLDQNKKIVSISENLEPCSNLPCQGYYALSPASYVLEVNLGTVQKHHLKLGQFCRWDNKATIYRQTRI